MNYAKSIMAVVTTVIAAIVPALAGDNNISPTEWVNIAILGVGAAAVFAAPNVPGAKYTKSVLAVLSAVLVGLSSVIVGGLTTSELLQLAVAAAGAIGVYAVPNSNTAVA